MITKNFTDHTGFSILLDQLPKRIISLVPSQTELLFHLGLRENIIGITKFCVHPQELVHKVSKIGGTKKFDFEKIDALKPDLIIANKEENYKEGIQQLRGKYPVWTSDIYNIEDALSMIIEVGKMTDTFMSAQNLNLRIKKRFSEIKNLYSGNILYFIWQKPYMVAGNNTFINMLLTHLGFNNMANNVERYPELTSIELKEYSPNYIFLSSEPFPFKEKHLTDYQKIFPSARVILVDGEMFSWYGNRLLLAADYLSIFLKP